MALGVLRPSDDRSGFRSGNIELGRFFQRFAGQSQFRVQLGVTHVAVARGQILGFATVSAPQVKLVQLAQHFQSTPMFLGVQKIKAALPSR